jgi:prolipoprotein diacylglyceryltransferase
MVAAILVFGLRILPRENMQILASVPIRRRPDGLWQGINLTWYGAMQMVAMICAVALALILAGSAAVPMRKVVFLLGVLLAAALPAARLVALIVERRSGTFTVGGAVFAATVLLPWVAQLGDALFGGVQSFPAVAALAVAYPVGEGIGRLACISFGCCYGRRLDQSPSWLRGLFGRKPAIVVGPTRKAAYAGHCDGLPLLPVPALSACVLSAVGVISVPIFLSGHFRAAALLSLGVAFVWRFASEFLRADYRGEGRLSVYQWMALACLAYAIPVVTLLAAGDSVPDIHRGLNIFASPLVWLALAGLGATVFFYLGISKMTTAIIELKVQDG